MLDCFPQPSDGGIKESTGLFDSHSEIFLVATASVLGLLCLAILAGLSYQYLIFVPRKRKGMGMTVL